MLIKDSSGIQDMRKATLSKEEKDLIKYLFRYDLEDLYTLLGYQQEYFKISYLTTKRISKKSVVITRGMMSLIKLPSEEWKKRGKNIIKRLRRKLCSWWLKNKNKLERIHRKLTLAHTVAVAVKSFASTDLSETLGIYLVAVIVAKEGIDNLCKKKLS